MKHDMKYLYANHFGWGTSCKNVCWDSCTALSCGRLKVVAISTNVCWGAILWLPTNIGGIYFKIHGPPCCKSCGGWLFSHWLPYTLQCVRFFPNSCSSQSCVQVGCLGLGWCQWQWGHVWLANGCNHGDYASWTSAMIDDLHVCIQIPNTPSCVV